MLEQCLRAGDRLWPNPPQFLDTIAEAIKLQQPGFNTFDILKELAQKEVFEMVSETLYKLCKKVLCMLVVVPLRPL